MYLSVALTAALAHEIRHLICAPKQLHSEQTYLSMLPYFLALFQPGALL